MGIDHTKYPVFGVQFHPESFMTDYGFVLIENFLKMTDLGKVRHTGSAIAEPRVVA